jgi:hypothetical protein
MNLPNGVFGPALNRWQAVTGAVISFGLCLLVGLGLDQGPTSAIFTASVVGVAVLIAGLTHARSTQRPRGSSL